MKAYVVPEQGEDRQQSGDRVEPVGVRQDRTVLDEFLTVLSLQLIKHGMLGRRQIRLGPDVNKEPDVSEEVVYEVWYRL